MSFQIDLLIHAANVLYLFWYVTFSGSEYSPSLLLLVSSHISTFALSH
jgi:hypothetical protein